MHIIEHFEQTVYPRFVKDETWIEYQRNLDFNFSDLSQIEDDENVICSYKSQN